MKAIARKRSGKASEAPPFHLQNRSSHEADRELDHLKKNCRNSNRIEG